MDTLYCFKYLGLDDFVKSKRVDVTTLYECIARHVLVETDANILHYLVDLKYHGELD